MNRQRKFLTTITYNEMGIIIDTEAEELDLSAEPERAGRLSNKGWIDFLVAQFDISRTSAKDMLHVMMSVKREDNFKKRFNGAKTEVEHEDNNKI